MFPISEDQPRRITPILSRGIIILCVLVFLWQVMRSPDEQMAVIFAFGFIPARLFGIAEVPAELAMLPAWATIFTSMFMHGGWLHLGGNMLFLWVFGDNIEDALGHARFLVFYMLCAAAGALLHGVMAPNSQVPLIGASGAVAGIVAAYLILHPRVKIWVLAFARIPLRIPAWTVLALWIGFQFVMLVFAGNDGVSWAAHVGGILLGAFLVLFMRRRGVPLFDREIVTPEAVETTVAKPRRRPPGAPPLSGSR
jgi:membrane associated rhomboid family serine protease